MSSITDDLDKPAKLLLIGKSGSGKTGSLVSLVTQGYNLRIIDSDKGIRPLRSLLTDPHYPYSKLISARNIDLASAVRYVSIDTSMKLRNISRKLPNGNTVNEALLAPTDAKAWPRTLELMDRWKEDDGYDLGPVKEWGLDDVLVIDSFSTLAKCVYYFSQSLNNRLGARDQGYDYQRDVGEAQSQLSRLLELLSTAAVRCNVIIISHITWVDDSKGTADRPKTITEDGGIALSSPDGYPSAIGRALSPHMGKHFNDVFVVRSAGSGMAVRRTISTVPTEGVVAKHSVYLEREYPITTGLAQIFAAMHEKPPPTDLLDAFGASSPTKVSGKPLPSAPVPAPKVSA
jgi:hypothetical protein